MNGHEKLRIAVGSYAKPTGKMCQSTAKTHERTIASHMYGVAVSAYETGSAVLSSTFRRAASAPTLLPAYQLSRIEGRSRPSVYGTACTMIDRTDVGNCRM